MACEATNPYLGAASIRLLIGAILKPPFERMVPDLYLGGYTCGVKRE